MVGTTTWGKLIKWSEPRSIAQLVSARGERLAIPGERGFYAFISGKRPPAPTRIIYLGVAAGKRGLYGRLGSYLRTHVTAGAANRIRHEGNRRLQFARIRGLAPTGPYTDETAANRAIHDRLLHVAWAQAPVDFSVDPAGARELMFLLERALVHHYRPLFNTVDWEADDLELELDDEV